MTKDDVQAAAKAAFKSAKGRGLAAIATGVGKSKIGVDLCAEVISMRPQANIVLAVPTKKLRDRNWEEEFIKWGHEDIYKFNVQRWCYASVNRIKDEDIDFLILDEGHNITEANSAIFKNNRVGAVLVLTATPPDPNNELDRTKLEIFAKHKINLIYTYSLDDAVRDGNVAPYEIRVVQCTLDNTTKYVPAGSKKKPFLQTERAAYDYLTKAINSQSNSKFLILKRMRLIKTLKSKTEIARRVMLRWLKPGDRFIIFCGSIEQTKKLSPYAYHSKIKDTDLNKFINGEIDRLAVVDGLNEGHNIPYVDGAVVVQVSSRDKDLVQRIGRTIRARPGHKAIIWIFVVIDTVDWLWLQEALNKFDKNRIRYIHYKNVI